VGGPLDLLDTSGLFDPSSLYDEDDDEDDDDDDDDDDGGDPADTATDDGDGDDDDNYDDATAADAADPDPATSPRILRAPSAPSAPSEPSEPEEPEIETYYELDADPPPEQQDSDDGGHDGSVEEMIVSVDDGSGRITESITDTNDATVTLMMAEIDEDEEPTRTHPFAEGAASVSSPIPAPERDPRPPRRSKRLSDGGLED
jgi:hypothetical protein